jgi:acyl carrier protein
MFNNIIRRTKFNRLSTLIKTHYTIKPFGAVNSTLRFYADQTEAAAKGSFLPLEEVQERVLTVIKTHGRLNVPQEYVTPKAHFMNDLKLDSLDTTEIVMEVEEEFMIEIPDSEAYNFNTVEELIKYVAQHPMAK